MGIRCWPYDVWQTPFVMLRQMKINNMEHSLDPIITLGIFERLSGINPQATKFYVVMESIALVSRGKNQGNDIDARLSIVF